MTDQTELVRGILAGAQMATGGNVAPDTLEGEYGVGVMRGWSSVMAIRAAQTTAPVTIQPTVLRASAPAPLESSVCDHCNSRFAIASRQFIRAMNGQAVKAVCPECECSLQLIEVDGRIASFEG